MRRREFLALLPGAAVWPLAARAQPAAKVARVGILSDEGSSLATETFRPLAKALRDLGYMEGRNIAFEHRSAEGRNEILPGLALELVGLKPNVVVTVGTPATRAAKSATRTIPIVFTRISDPIASGLVSNLARPDANLTGLSVMNTDLAAKKLEMLVEIIPGVKRVGALWDPTFPPAALELREIERAARLLNVELQPLGVRAAEELEPAVHAVVEQRGQALIVVTAAFFVEQRRRVAEIAINNRLPTMLHRRELVEAGGLMSYGANRSDMYRRAATYVDKILKGAKPSDLPVEQPTKFELVINLKTAKALGLAIPLTLQARADDVIE